MLPLIAAGISLVTEFAPAIIRHFAGDKAGEVAESVATVANKLTGKDILIEQGLKETKEALRKNPELLVQFEKDMAQIDFATEQAYLEDRQNARARDVALRQVGDKNWRANIMLLAAFLAVTAIALTLAIYKPDGIIVGFMTTIGGMFARNIGTAFDFEFGSSRGSKEKNQLFNGLSKPEK